MARSHSTRRKFLGTLGSGAVIGTAYRLSSHWLSAQSPNPALAKPSLFDPLDFNPVPVSHEDRVILPKGFRHEVLVSRGAILNDRGETYGDDNDFVAILPRGDAEGWLWVNHESTDVFFLKEGPVPAHTVDRELIAQYLTSMGGSCIRIARNTEGRWRPVLPDRRNFRLTGMTPGIEFTGPARGSEWLAGATSATGSVANCGGGITPWGTILSAEENVYAVFGDAEQGDPKTQVNTFYDRPDRHYGYMVEIDPDAKTFHKHTALGRFAHENIVFAVARDGRLVGYMGDDRPNQCLYKYISTERYDPRGGKENRRLLTDGMLHVADTVRGRWIPLNPATNRALKAAGYDKARVCVNTRTAAMMCGGTPHGRPEGISRNESTGEVFVSLSAHPVPGSFRNPTFPTDLAGAIARIREAGNDPGAMEFQFDLTLMGGPATGLAWPDNLTFVNPQHMMICTDYKGTYPSRAQSTHAALGNNFLMVTPMTGPGAGKVLRFATAPREAEFASPVLTPDREELWVSVQHPGEGSTRPDALISHWPGGGHSWPRSSLISISRES